jgi:polysaccharide export outer membrane protein
MKQNFARALPFIVLGMLLSFGALAEQPVSQGLVEVMKVEPVAMDAAEKVEPAVVEVDSGYQIGPEDILEISVWKEEGLKKEVLVRPDGGLSFPLIGEVQAAGKTAGQLKKEISQRLEKFIPDPVVSIALLKVIGNKIYVIGKVNRPGEFPAGRYVDVLQALSMANGLTPFAAENSIKVLRKEGGKDVVFPFRYSEVKNGENLEQNIQLKGGDVVVVP